MSVTGVTLNQPSMTLVAGGATGTLSATVAPANATNKAVVWYSSDVAVATVNEGVVTPLKAGTTTITVKTLDGNKSATSTVTVEAAPIAVEGITLNKETMTLVVDGANSELVATIVPMEATNKTIEWSSSNNDVATVTDGLVTPLKAGTTTITATTKDRGYKATCEVIVIDKAILTLIAGDKSVLVVHNNGDPLTSNTAASLDNINQWKQLGANGDLEARFVNAPNNFGSLILTPNHTNNTVTITATRRLLRSVSGLVTVEIRDKENPDLVATFTVQVNSRAGSTSLNIGEVKVK
ncbi:Ig-like domain-containing protein [Alkaliphilus transvaalensis]|uniref:Ig-like domain-containing protein n=1 Tax=Alkaliphilus transvaalensis TaxID=114628 RepID=UPI0038BB2D26